MFQILEKFLGFSVQEFSHKKKLAKSDPQVSNELRLVSWIVYIEIDIENDILFKFKFFRAYVRRNIKLRIWKRY